MASALHQVHATWKDNMEFDAQAEGAHLTLDAAPEHGGTGSGFRPKQLLLTALAGCTGMDVVAILRKMREPLKHFALRVEGDLSDGQPAVYERIRIVYEFASADGLAPAKVERAVTLSQEKYCGVSAMLGKASEITHEIRYIG
jgi:putative redox protein